jgi:hypothetical protein
MMERRPWLKRVDRRLPLRYRDILPAATSTEGQSSSMASNSAALASEESNRHADAHPVVADIRSIGGRVQRFFTTHCNIFGLFRRYHREGPPLHDPEANITSEDMCDAGGQEGVSTPTPSSDTHWPYPNLNAFRLSNWYWNGGPQKSQASFKELVEIIGDPEFSPTDVRDAKWDQINRILADDEVWMDQDDGWQKTQVSIVVPFQPRRSTVSSHDAGPQEYVVGDFYHRSVVAVVKEKLSNPVDIEHFHYEPYELRWQPGTSPESVRVHGELYTSQVFLDAHNTLQNSPPEPGCNRPRNIIALMFYSDSTHLTSFGDTTLWPVYLYLGNESKYRRCKPSCHAANHIAYFRKVCTSCLSLYLCLTPIWVAT